MTQPSAADSHILNTPVSELADVGPARAKQLISMGIVTLGDLLNYFPRDYQHEFAEQTIDRLGINGVQTTRGEVVAVNYIPSRPRPRFEATLDDGTGKCALVWFNGAYLRRQIHPGITLCVKGKVRFFHNIPQMANPKWHIVETESHQQTAARLRAIYPASAKLPSETIERIIAGNLEQGLQGIEEWFPQELLDSHSLVSRRQAYRLIHQPPDLRAATAARRRLVYDELMLMQLALGLSKLHKNGRISAPILRADRLLDERINRRFSFTMTTAQRNAVFDIVRDVQSGKPMHRLLQGDVGSGKTAVAVYAMLLAVANRMQAVLLAPTEVLAEQHYVTLCSLLSGSSVNVALFTSRTRRQLRSQLLKQLADGSIHLAVGTQALLQSDIDFANLGLVVVDEQHKLGVLQRADLHSKGMAPHYLVMTATPIPRTLALSYFADFDVTTLGELPPGRQPVETRFLRRKQADQAYAFIRQKVAAGEQAYIVMPQVDDTGSDQLKSVLRQYEALSQHQLAGLKLGVLHGQMPTDEKQKTMLAFRDKRIDVLVATTVIEVGIDVPNATVILIDHADSFGLSQLHQLRGRVGRGTQRSYCLLLADPATEMAETRLNAMVRTTDGFEIAEMDLSLRGPGQFFGTRQHGLPEFKLADLSSEMTLLQTAKEDATTLLKHDPRLHESHNAALKSAILRQFQDKLELAQIG